MRDVLIKLYKSGLISHKPLYYLDLSNKVKEFIRCGMTQPEAIKQVSKDNAVSVQTIYKAIKLVSTI